MSWHFSQALVEEYSGEKYSDGEHCVLSKLSLSASKGLCKDKTKDISSHSQFGTIYEPSKDSHGEVMLTLFRADSHAKTYQSQEKGLVSKAKEVAFGLKCFDWFAKYDQGSSLWKIPQLSLVEGLDVFSETWPRSGTMRNGMCSELTTSAPRTRGTEFGFLPTPTASMGKHLQFSQKQIQKVKKRHQESGLTFSMSITEIITLNFGMKINPTFVEEIMGFPKMWTDLKPLETHKFHKWLRTHSRCYQKELEVKK